MSEYEVTGQKDISQMFSEGITVIILGDTGIGKTAMAATFPAPIFLDVDVGAEFVDAPRIVPRTKAEFVQAVADLERKFADEHCPYKTIVLDTLDEMVALFKESILGPSDKMTISDWDRLLNQVMPLLRRLKRIRSHFVICAQSKAVSLDGDKGTYWSLAVPSSARVRVPTMAGWVFHLIAAGKDGVQALTKPTQGQRGLYQAKDRSGRLPQLIDPTFDAFLAALEGGHEDGDP